MKFRFSSSSGQSRMSSIAQAWNAVVVAAQIWVLRNGYCVIYKDGGVYKTGIIPCLIS